MKRRVALQFVLALCASVSLYAAAPVLKETRPKHVLFVCTGNFYRSRFAEAFFNQKAAEEHLDCHASSRGFGLEASQHGVSPIAKRELLKLGVSRQFYQGNPKPLTKEDLKKSDYVVLMDEAEHRPMLEKLFPTHDDHKIHYWHIPDSGKMEPDEACLAMASEVQKLIHKIEH